VFVLPRFCQKRRKTIKDLIFEGTQEWLECNQRELLDIHAYLGHVFVLRTKVVPKTVS